MTAASTGALLPFYYWITLVVLIGGVLVGMLKSGAVTRLWRGKTYEDMVNSAAQTVALLQAAVTAQTAEIASLKREIHTVRLENEQLRNDVARLARLLSQAAGTDDKVGEAIAKILRSPGGVERALGEP